MDFQQLADCGEMVLQHALRAHRHQGDLAQDGFLRRPWRFLLCAVSGQQLQQQFSSQDYISSCCKKMLYEVLEKVFKSFRPLLGLPDADDDAFEEYSEDVEE
ncbi:Maturin [Sciurus carolinensis]|uniref:Maturin n=1 Tax=Sciurus carolinensis TaxID=30640 RepID=A0AA41MUS8_SCICA|nr:Maturin [Sciurus carolinensis]